MGWTLIVSEDERFQREAIARAGKNEHLVGATGDATARSLVRGIDVSKILVDARDDVGQRFLSVLRTLPDGSLPDIDVVVVGRPNRKIGRFKIAANVAGAFASAGQRLAS